MYSIIPAYLWMIWFDPDCSPRNLVVNKALLR